jgi:hypothetical protein
MSNDTGPAMRGSDYNRMAEVLHAVHKRQPGLYQVMKTSVLAEALCDAFSDEDPGFDRRRFMRAVREGLLYDPAAIDEDRPPCAEDYADLDAMIEDEAAERPVPKLARLMTEVSSWDSQG